VAFSLDGSFAYVGEPAARSVRVVATASGMVVRSIGVGVAPTSVTLTPDGATLLVGHRGLIDGGVVFIDVNTNRVLGNVLTGGDPAPPLITASSRYAFVHDTTGMRQITMLDVRERAVVSTLVPR
jgi:DNA-binding beta-propeller fold protein YncE